MVSKALKLVLCYSSLCTKLQNGINTDDRYACVQAIVSHRTNIYQTDLNSQHIGTSSPKSEPNSYKYFFCYLVTKPNSASIITEIATTSNPTSVT